MAKTISKIPTSLMKTVRWYEIYNFVKKADELKESGMEVTDIYKKLAGESYKNRAIITLLRACDLANDKGICSKKKFAEEISKHKYDMGQKAKEDSDKKQLAKEELLKSKRKYQSSRNKIFWGQFIRWGSVVLGVGAAVATAFAVPSIAAAVAGLIGSTASIGAAVGVAIALGAAIYGIYTFAKSFISKGIEKGKALADEGYKTFEETKKLFKSAKEKYLEALVESEKSNSAYKELEDFEMTLDATKEDKDRALEFDLFKMEVPEEYKDEFERHKLKYTEKVDEAQTHAELVSAKKEFEESVDHIPSNEEIDRLKLLSEKYKEIADVAWPMKDEYYEPERKYIIEEANKLKDEANKLIEEDSGKFPKFSRKKFSKEIVATTCSAEKIDEVVLKAIRKEKSKEILTKTQIDELIKERASKYFGSLSKSILEVTSEMASPDRPDIATKENLDKFLDNKTKNYYDNSELENLVKTAIDKKLEDLLKLSSKTLNPRQKNLIFAQRRNIGNTRISAKTLVLYLIKKDFESETDLGNLEKSKVDELIKKYVEEATALNDDGTLKESEVVKGPIYDRFSELYKEERSNKDNPDLEEATYVESGFESGKNKNIEIIAEGIEKYIEAKGMLCLEYTHADAVALEKLSTDDKIEKLKKGSELLVAVIKYEKELVKAKEEEKNKKKEFEKAEEAAVLAAKEKENAYNSYKELSDMRKEFDAINSTIDEQKSELADIDVEIGKRKNAEAEAKKEYNDAKAAAEKAEEKLEEKLGIYNDIKSKGEEEIRDYKKQISKIEGKLTAAKSDAEKGILLAEKNNLEEKIKNTKGIITAALNEYSKEKDYYETLKEEVTSAESKFNKKKEEVDELERTKAALEAKLNDEVRKKTEIEGKRPNLVADCVSAEIDYEEKERKSKEAEETRKKLKNELILVQIKTSGKERDLRNAEFEYDRDDSERRRIIESEFVYKGRGTPKNWNDLKSAGKKDRIDKVIKTLEEKSRKAEESSLRLEGEVSGREDYVKAEGVVSGLKTEMETTISKRTVSSRGRIKSAVAGVKKGIKKIISKKGKSGAEVDREK